MANRNISETKEQRNRAQCANAVPTYFSECRWIPIWCAGPIWVLMMSSGDFWIYVGIVVNCGDAEAEES
jgi:hypothetical protein